MVTLHLDSPVARGNTSDAYRWGRDAVVKVLRPGIPVEWAAREARTTELVHAAGLPAPAVLDLTTVDGRPGIVFERIIGVSMWEHMLADPHDIPRLTTLLARLQAEINATTAPPGIPKLVDRLEEKILCARLLSPSERTSARAALVRQQEGEALCHFDIHPNNVLMGPAGPMIIDWYDAAAGSPAADLVRSSALMRRDAAEGHLPGVDPPILDVVHDHYIAAVVRDRQLDDDVLLSWESPILAARLAEPVPEAAQLATHECWRAANASRSTPLGESLRFARSLRQG